MLSNLLVFRDTTHIFFLFSFRCWFYLKKNAINFTSKWKERIAQKALNKTAALASLNFAGRSPSDWKAHTRKHKIRFHINVHAVNSLIPARPPVYSYRYKTLLIMYCVGEREAKEEEKKMEKLWKSLSFVLIPSFVGYVCSPIFHCCFCCCCFVMCRSHQKRPPSLKVWPNFNLRPLGNSHPKLGVTNIYQPKYISIIYMNFGGIVRVLSIFFRCFSTNKSNQSGTWEAKNAVSK